MKKYLYLKSFLTGIICCSVVSLGFSSPITAEQNIIDNSEKIDYTHHKTTVNGILMHYVIGGKGDPVVLLHGWPETWYEWRHIIPQLIDNNYTVIAPDMRGFGDSEKPQIGYDTKTVAEDIYQLVKKLGNSKIYIVAHDWGGPVAYSYAAAHPQDVRKMVILRYLITWFWIRRSSKLFTKGIMAFVISCSQGPSREID